MFKIKFLPNYPYITEMMQGTLLGTRELKRKKKNQKIRKSNWKLKWKWGIEFSPGVPPA